MGIYLQFPAGWFAILGMLYIPYFLLYFFRKSYKRQELITQFLTGSIVLLIAFLIELVAISLNVWTYFPGNWPITLWIAYFGAGLLGYQIVKVLEEGKPH